MKFSQNLLSNMFLRNLLSELGARTRIAKIYKFTPYFQYKIGEYQRDYNLYFPFEPFTIQYKNEIFNKLAEYRGYDIILFLEYHFYAFEDKTSFLRFVRYEISERLRQKGLKKLFCCQLQSASCWVSEKEEELRKSGEGLLKAKPEQGVISIVPNLNARSDSKTDIEVKSITEKLGIQLEKIMVETQRDFKGLTSSFSTGNIQLNNRNHEEKLIQLLILVQQIQAPSQFAKGEQLFKKFTASDIASLLHLHFDTFRENKIPTLQKKVGEQSDRIKSSHPKVKKLTDALQDFFY